MAKRQPSKRRLLGRKDSSSEQYLARVPRDVIDRVRGRQVTLILPAAGNEPERITTTTLGTFAKFSLQTRDRNAGDVRRASVKAELTKLYDAVRSGPSPISERLRTALAGEAYHMLVDTYSENPGTVAQWEAWKGLTRAALEGRIPGCPPIPVSAASDDRAVAVMLFGNDLTAGVNALPETPAFEIAALQQRCGQVAFWTLRKNGIEIDSSQGLDLLREVARGCLDAGWTIKRMAAGDYRPDPIRERFPPVEKPKKRVTFEAVITHWLEHERGRPSSGANRRTALSALAKRIGHDDAARVTKQDILGWRSDMMSSDLAPGTVKTRLNDARAVFAYAVGKELIERSPFEGVEVSFKANRMRPVEAKRPYSPDQVARLLDICSKEKLPYRRWIPLLAATTGARVAELAQLWGNRVRQIDGIWTLEIRAAEDGGSLKTTESSRDVPLHPALVEAGFLDFVRATKGGPLFYRRKAGRSTSATHPSRILGSMLGKWIRSKGFTDTTQDPNHAFRHYWKTQAHRHGVDVPTSDYLAGHKSPGMGAHYRHISEDRAALAAAIAKVPVPTLSAPERMVRADAISVPAE